MGAISCLEMFASGENLADQQLPELITLAFPSLLGVVSAPEGRSESLIYLGSEIAGFLFASECRRQKSFFLASTGSW